MSIKLNSKPHLNVTLDVVYKYGDHEACNLGKPRVVCRSIDFGYRPWSHKFNINNVSLFVTDLLTRLNKYNIVRRLKPRTRVTIDLHDIYFPIETICDIYSGLVGEISHKHSVPTTNKVVGFGSIERPGSKPQREEYNHMTLDSHVFDYLETKIYNAATPEKYYDIRDLIKKYKYFIDLKGHTYSTKAYTFIASNRVTLKCKHQPGKCKMLVGWESDIIKPWKNYIPINWDLSDLKEKYEMIEKCPDKYDQIIHNNRKLFETTLSNDMMIQTLVNEILSHVVVE